MKSLDKLSYIEHRIEYLTNYVKELEKENIKCDIDIQKERIAIYKGIKQDLEILEILRKNLYIEYDTRLYVKHSFDDDHKDFNIVKQWLEENENE